MTALDRFYNRYGNVVKRDTEGNPSIFVRHPKMKSSDFDAILPDHTHPAFIVNNREYDSILIGKYMDSELTPNGTRYSLPNAPVARGLSQMDSLARIRQAGSGFSGMTIADFGLFALLAQMFPDRMRKMQGNTNFGASSDYYGSSNGHVAAWARNTAVSAGDRRAFGGVEYKCLINHTTSDLLSPENAPHYWERLNRIGGVPDGTMINGQYTTTLTGSGPLSWNFFADVNLEADFIGIQSIVLQGVMFNGAELNILPNNDAASPSADLSINSTAWRAILPHANDNGYDLVAPNTPGTLKIANINNIVTWVARDIDDSEYQNQVFNTPLMDVVVDTVTIPYTPYVLYELGLLPLPGKYISGRYVIGTAKNSKRLLGFGSNPQRNGEAVGFIFWVGGYGTNTGFGTRSRFLEES